MQPIINQAISTTIQQKDVIHIHREIDRLVQYGILTELIEDVDITYVRNRILECLKLDDYLEFDPNQDTNYINILQHFTYIVNMFYCACQCERRRISFERL